MPRLSHREIRVQMQIIVVLPLKMITDMFEALPRRQTISLRMESYI